MSINIVSKFYKHVENRCFSSIYSVVEHENDGNVSIYLNKVSMSLMPD